MKASKLISQLQQFVDEGDDLEVVFSRFSDLDSKLEKFTVIKDVTGQDTTDKTVIVLWDA
ncbi:hypothetical protein D3C75_1319250 [compost metagenome]